MKRFKAKIKYKGKTNNMLVSGKDEKSVIKNITDFYILTLKKKKLAESINSERFLVT